MQLRKDSDTFLCCHEARLAREYDANNKKMSDMSFVPNSSATYRTDSQILKFDDAPTVDRILCEKRVAWERMGNNARTLNLKNKNELMLKPCKTSSFVNGQVGTQTLYCSRQHQLFDNLTKQQQETAQP